MNRHRDPYRKNRPVWNHRSSAPPGPLPKKSAILKKMLQIPWKSQNDLKTICSWYGYDGEGPYYHPVWVSMPWHAVACSVVQLYSWSTGSGLFKPPKHTMNIHWDILSWYDFRDMHFVSLSFGPSIWGTFRAVAKNRKCPVKCRS